MPEVDRWEAAEEARRAGQRVDAEVTGVLTGGLVVRVLGLRGFLPPSVVAPDLRDSWREASGQQIHVELLEVNRKKNRVIVRQVE